MSYQDGEGIFQSSLPCAAQSCAVQSRPAPYDNDLDAHGKPAIRIVLIVFIDMLINNARRAVPTFVSRFAN
jgi:hypothetical protein